MPDLSRLAARKIFIGLMAAITAHAQCREEKGVKVRIEIGPKEAEQKLCIIARSQPEAGRVAYKVSSEVGKRLPAEVQRLLSMPDSEVPAGDTAKYEIAKAER